MEKFNLSQDDSYWWKEVYLPSRSTIHWKFVQAGISATFWEGKG